MSEAASWAVLVGLIWVSLLAMLWGPLRSRLAPKAPEDGLTPKEVAPLIAALKAMDARVVSLESRLAGMLVADRWKS